ncbi:MAG: MAPEG family protein [Alphaproteobacteria bacterium]|jgi:uncharacterized MAPEG superfamily protein|nr:MAPEG family protein [Planctomycetaceae bacterium]MBT3788139.1 MAPEG family protein [Alphaproteobacteria bacterium]MBT4544068.1 MAPEG family protein [Alphaproteobacteria bacterium]MBT7744782.1 MAPEG family protein [Alphaproteobacteria bacterium]
MSTELLYLFLTSVLLIVLWTPYIFGQVMVNGLLTQKEYAELRSASNTSDNFFLRRADRAHVNLVEQFGGFAGLVIVAHLTGVSTEITAGASAFFFWARIAHAVVMLTGFKYLMARTIIFTAAWVALMLIAWEIAAAKVF